MSWVPLIPLQKLPVRFSPEGLRKYHISWGFFSWNTTPFMLYSTHPKASSYHYFKMRQTAPMEAVGCTIDGSQEAKKGNPRFCLSPKEE